MSSVRISSVSLWFIPTINKSLGHGGLTTVEHDSITHKEE